MASSIRSRIRDTQKALIKVLVLVGACEKNGIKLLRNRFDGEICCLLTGVDSGVTICLEGYAALRV